MNTGNLYKSIAEKVSKNEIILDMSSMECRPFLSGGLIMNNFVTIIDNLVSKCYLVDRRDPIESL
jgi:hypothetical protein